MDTAEAAPVRSRKKEDNSSQTKPLYQRITDALRERIATGVWAPGDALPSRRALAQELGTTHITIDKAIRQLVKEGLLSATVGSGTFVKSRDEANTDASAQARSGRSRIGVVLGTHTFTNEDASRARQIPYFSEVLQGIQDTFFGKDVDVNYIGLARGDYESLPLEDFAGLIVIAPTLSDIDDIRLLNQKCRIVAVGISSDVTEEDKQLPAVDTDNVQGAYDAVQHLLSLGHTKIALVNASVQQSNLYDRYCGYIAALSDARVSIAPEHLLLYPAYNNVSHEVLIERWLSRLQEENRLPTAILSCDLQMTLFVLDVLARHEIKVPEQISVVGYDDAIQFQYHQPPITVVAQPIYTAGKRAAERLMESLESPDGAYPIGTIRLPCELIVRKSTAPPAA
ncbi:arabinose metabolism transcriptional repressor [Capsulimonas corticalis]|uniref:Arabinose metabolism transcriptional repressor n=1 Tax=Capsulimonas corticalis TaxID=2219043 RepID=A0A402D1U2_9BACT|nr:substrate-binding domain-containing protein [Capsulimonas corticalis]BDI30076.1 arabinose metabolism transcriptional repressor [Capsulimonas corticalis]